jgi:hypothetical protein
MPTISEAEKQRRLLAVGSVIGTHVMEGLEPDAETRAIFQRYAEGGLDSDELSEALHAHAFSVASRDLPFAKVA